LGLKGFVVVVASCDDLSSDTLDHCIVALSLVAGLDGSYADFHEVKDIMHITFIP